VSGGGEKEAKNDAAVEKTTHPDSTKPTILKKRREQPLLCAGPEKERDRDAKQAGGRKGKVFV